MSYEGYSQFLCRKGHYWILDCNSADGTVECLECGGRVVWENMVNITNGSYDDDGTRIDGYVELKVKSTKVCKECKRPTETTYHIPSKKTGHHYRS